MVETTLRVVANSLFSQDFGPLVQSMNHLATRGLRHAERLQRLGLWGLKPRPVYDALTWCVFSGVRLPPPLRDIQDITLTLEHAVNSVIDHRLAHPTDSADLLNVLLHAEGGTWPRRRVRHEALTFMLAGGRRRACADDLGRLPWTTACLQESQRYFSTVWVIARRAIDDDVIGAHHIRRGSAPNNRPRSAYLPFGGGRRICIGQSFALMEMVLIAAIMSQRFTFDLAPDYPVELEA